MFFIPLSQIESVGLVVHALRVAGGEADCSQCPVRKVCMKQCLVIADSIEAMIRNGTLPALGDEDEVPMEDPDSGKPSGEGKPVQTSAGSTRKSHLEVLK